MNPNKRRLVSRTYNTSGHVYMNQPTGNKSTSPYKVFSSTNQPVQQKSGGCGCGSKTQRR
ncbi:hypothetical protein [Alkalihalobacillus sp. BA299]|uniref:hypothetical protein n=1 Tax=Alkalihalobacillus sp. BA299 TaxID=2815938 RepID=UPI001ADBFC21|nr:hypothetical protein [Alkalihalobacillus sp. BA299]